MSRGRKPVGCVYWDRSSKSDRRFMVREHACWRAEITINKRKYRARFRFRNDAEMWVQRMAAPFAKGGDK